MRTLKMPAKLLLGIAAFILAVSTFTGAYGQEMVLTDNIFLNMVKFYAKNGDIERALLELKKLQDTYPQNAEYKKYEEILRSEYARGFKQPEEKAQPKVNTGTATNKKLFRKEEPSENEPDLPPGVAEKNARINSGRLRYVYELVGRGDEVQAIAKLREIVATEPRFLEALNLLGDLYLNRKNHEEALAFYKKTLGIKQDAETNYKIAVCYKVLNNIDNAIIHFDIAARMNPKHELANLALGNIWRFRRSFKLARGYYEQALKANSKLVEAHLGMADCIYNEGNLDEATSAYAYIITNFPMEYPAYLGLSRILIRNKQFSEAKAVIMKAKELAPQASQVYELLGVLSHEMKDDKAAIENFRRAINFDAKSQTAYESLINILISEKKYDEALVQIKNSLAKFPENARLYYLAGIIYSGSKNDVLALKNLLDAYKLEANNIEIVLAIAILYENGFKYKEAVDKYREALLIAEEKKDNRYINNIQEKIEVLEKKVEKFSEKKL